MVAQSIHFARSKALYLLRAPRVYADRPDRLRVPLNMVSNSKVTLVMLANQSGDAEVGWWLKNVVRIGTSACMKLLGP